MLLTLKAYSVHLFTATGAVFAMLALLEAAKGDWAMMFLWLVVAFIVDGIDGPLARRYHVKKNAQIIDGVLLDLIIDYLTYVFIPAFALFQSDLLPGWTGWVAIIAITFTSALYFADSRMKTADNSFQGFPGCWNMAALIFFAVQPAAVVILGAVAFLAVAMFTPLKFIHPVRTERWRSLSLPVALIWTALAGWAAWTGFAQPLAVTYGLIVSSLYLMTVGIVQQVVPKRESV
ncbi:MULTISPECIES: CDP-alcohol phosphatidyltransferase family protein [Roseinatronobacter]|uniref:Phosphatidylcholine synthase n=1 Tax=Roseinatronobacter domitianus TaxID=2940293 RepID=A0ABT0M424_9RHOB|nr:CDP-alcohol phosphatidyltransferase family protein [Roseibaca sp.]MCL1629604.1 CDP-alcohol phosphatidyltransferase family protein [Roseibaca domitiana]